MLLANRETDADQNVEVLEGEGRCQVLVLDGARMTEGLENDNDEKDQPAEKRSTKRRAGTVGVDEGKQRVE